MSLRIIAGSSGQGKTRLMLEEVIRLSKENPQQNCYIIVPEQFSLEMQRKLVEIHPKHGYFNIDVLSFYRLAYRVFDECSFQPKDILEDLGVSLILRKILAEHEDEFPFFKRNIRKAGFVDELKSILIECIGYGVTWEQMQDMDGKLVEYPGLMAKCTELGKIFEYFDRELSSRFMVAEQILDVLSELVPSSNMLRDGIFYFDGFTGFTPVQMKFLRELLKVSAQVNVAITTDETPFVREGKICQSSTNTKKGSLGQADEHSWHGVEDGRELFHFSDKTLHALAEICRETGTKVDTPVWLFHEKTPRFANEELAFLERHLFRFKKKCFDKDVYHLHMTACRNPDEEAEYILHQIEKMIRQEGYRYRDFAILTGKVEEYASSFRRKADILKIPLFEDTKKRVSYHSGVETLRALFHLAVTDYSYEGVFRYLKSGMSDFTDEETDTLENYVVWAGIRGYSMWKNPFVRRMNRIEERRAQRLQTLREKLLAETGECTQILKDHQQSVREKMKALYNVMCRLQYDRKLKELADIAEMEGDYVREKEYRQLFSLILDLLDKIVGIFGEEKIPVEELSQILDAGLDALELGTPPLSMDALILGDLKRTRLPDIKVLFIAGMNDGSIPPSLEDGGMINDDEKQILEEWGMHLSLCFEEQSMEDDFYIYLALSKPEEEIYFTYAAQDNGGAAKSPSPLLKECLRLFPHLKEHSYPGQEQRYYFNEEDSRELLIKGLQQIKNGEEISMPFRLLLRYWYDKKELRDTLMAFWAQNDRITAGKMLPKELMRELFGRELKGSVTRLERFAACPYQYYCIYGLELREREEYTVRPVDLGNLFHHALESFSRRLKQSGYRWKDIPEEVADDWIKEAVETAVGEDAGDVLKSTARNQYKVHMVERILRRTVRVLKIHLEHSHMEPDRFELHFGRTDRLDSVHLPLKDGNRMQLEGFIDRVDVCEEKDRILLRIIDYKSGVESFDLGDLYHGLQMQLVIYMNVAAEIYQNEKGKEAVPAGMFYYNLKDPIFKAEGSEEETVRKSFRMSGYANSDADILEKLEEGQENFISASIRLTKKGVPYKNAAVLATDDFYAIGRYMRRKIMEMGEAIYDGKISVSPYKNEKGTACDYCPYNAVCGFDVKLEGFAYRDFKKESSEEVLQAIRKENSEHEVTSISDGFDADRKRVEEMPENDERRVD